MKNIIFDLGDVIIPIDLRAPLRNFAQLANRTEAEMEALWKQHGIWKQYETGLVDDEAFRAAVRSLVRDESDEPDRWADEIIDTAWNSVLLDLPVERIERIQSLKGKYRLFLLSNTNAIHIREVDNRLAELGQPSLESLFDQVYYSHIVRMLKPNPDIYGYVLEQANLEPSETLFLDDNLLNIQAAAALGIRAVQVVAPKTILDYLDEIGA
ncbi:HAD family hydrolase [Fibrella forsythiae]|uniref:HAD family phosphatase n=1 Tax=Fibrella forsythiae TaxID=2817061 RepID=A0ABS3JFZ3_9BACT|nr:HAD family phosphatase [Fibrella forsythiae]MBO0948924.1 HAD family phosphatase [Fibrella forsythiae]